MDKIYTSYHTISYCCYCGKEMIKSNYDDYESILCYCPNAVKELNLKEKIKIISIAMGDIKIECIPSIFKSSFLSYNDIDMIEEWNRLEKEKGSLWEELRNLENPYKNLDICISLKDKNIYKLLKNYFKEINQPNYSTIGDLIFSHRELRKKIDETNFIFISKEELKKMSIEDIVKIIGEK